ncbi:tubulin beta chain [Nematostella vectensis]|uniref:tubulin beta chain n=1 Tax=Nematostella vectensis TaxID=45351 RepID=UPI00207782B7|nr:tubulin beta chain [Nematostella vectensis]
MSSILLPVGQCGNQIGHELMTLVEKQCEGKPLSHRDGKLRCVCVDSESKVIASNRRSDGVHGQNRDSNIIAGRRGRGNNFALGYHGNSIDEGGTSLLHMTMDAMRKEVERCDSFAGTIVMHSLTGGTGSGLGARLVETLSDAYPLAHVMSVAVSPHVSGESPLQHYNSLLSLAALQRNADGILLFHNDDVLRQVMLQRVKISEHQVLSGGSVSLIDMNRSIAKSLVGVLQPLGEKPKSIKKTSKKVGTRKGTKEEKKCTLNSSHFPFSKAHNFSMAFSDSSMCPTPCSYLNESSSTTGSDDETRNDMCKQPGATASALMRYRGITSHLSKGSGTSKPQEASLDVPKGNEPWEMLRSICPEPSKKFVSVYHSEKVKVGQSWDHLCQSLVHSMNLYDKSGHPYSTLASLLIARGDTDNTFAESALKIEKRLKGTLRCVEWNPFPVDFWISPHSVVGSPFCGQSLTLCTNSNRARDSLGNILTRAKSMFDAGAYLHWFEKHGCVKNDFLDGFSTLQDIIDEYNCATS